MKIFGYLFSMIKLKKRRQPSFEKHILKASYSLNMEELFFDPPSFLLVNLSVDQWFYVVFRQKLRLYCKKWLNLIVRRLGYVFSTLYLWFDTILNKFKWMLDKSCLAKLSCLKDVSIKLQSLFSSEFIKNQPEKALWFFYLVLPVICLFWLRFLLTLEKFLVFQKKKKFSFSQEVCQHPLHPMMVFTIDFPQIQTN